MDRLKKKKLVWSSQKILSKRWGRNQYSTYGKTEVTSKLLYFQNQFGILETSAGLGSKASICLVCVFMCCFKLETVWTKYSQIEDLEPDAKFNSSQKIDNRQLIHAHQTLMYRFSKTTLAHVVSIVNAPFLACHTQQSQNAAWIRRSHHHAVSPRWNNYSS